jgi:hypothetical protein
VAWFLTLNATVTYIDETTSWVLGSSPEEAGTLQRDSPRSPNSSRDGASEHSSPPPSEERHHYPAASQSPVGLGMTYSPPEDRSVPRSQPSPIEKPFALPSNSDRGISHSPAAGSQSLHSHHVQLPTPTRSVGSLSQLSLSDSFSLMNETEAHLFRHYVQRLAVCVSTVRCMLGLRSRYAHHGP